MKIGFWGFGNMASAIVEGLLGAGACAPEDLAATALHYDRLVDRCEPYGIRAYERAEDMIQEVDWLVLAVKPYLLESLLPPVTDKLEGKVVLSLAVGKDFAAIEELIPGTKHLSTLPNLPMAVGSGILICESKHSLEPQDLAVLQALFGKISCIEFVNAKQFAIAGTISGCGPAFTALFTEALADAGVKHGLTREQALRLTAHMIRGSAEMEIAGLHPALLKDKVCSPGGTTIQGVTKLEETGFRGSVIAAVDQIQSKS